MSKKVLVISGSARKNGNSDRLADAFIAGAKEAGHETEKIYVKDLNVNGCIGCMGCQRNGGKCVQKDDMQEVYQKVLDAFRNYISCFKGEGNKEGGYVFAFGTIKKTDVEGSEALEQARHMGFEIE